MSLLERIKTLPAKSLYVAVLVAMVTTLSLSYLAFQMIANHVQKMEIDPTFFKFDELQLESARTQYERHGVEGLKEYLAKLDRIFGGSHYLLSADGIDLVTGTDRSALLPRPPADSLRVQAHGRWTISHRAPDGSAWFAAEGQLGRPHLLTFLPYYFLVIGATCVLCWLAAVGVISPIRRIAATIALFGQGDLAARVKTARPDEIGQLGRSFNQMAERLERLIVSERRLLGDISHELRSPLARLKFAVKLARTSPDPKAALDRIERDVDRITSLVADIVEITFIEGDPAVQDTGIVQVGEVLEEVVRDCALEAHFRECSIDLSGNLEGMVLGNRELLRRAIENVLRNGIRYSPKQSAIRVTATETEQDATITVRDFGPGVPDDALGRIFDPFFRVEEARDTNGGGSGMGLSIAKRAVQLHHGTIVAENAKPGLRVLITIPFAQSDGATSGQLAVSREGNSKALNIS
ncbi:MAG TPA: ATP-binding protein [Terracidiphilus sp.]|jgi:signal transduction histidine kinase|nr:ATP-binding protein [Terracidiphilus sp.]